MNILVTGGAGFIGSAVIRKLINHSLHSIVNVDKLTYAGNLQALSVISDSPRYCFEQVDICNYPELTELFLMYQPDCVLHLAAESHVDRSISGPAEFIQTNIVGTSNLLEAARSYWSSLSTEKKATFRFHHISTDEVFGDLADSNGFFTEESAYAPSSPYSASKASADHLVRAWHRTYGLPTIITNCSNNYGPYQYPEKLIPLIINNALSGKPLLIYGDGSQIRDWLYVDDHVDALLCVLEKGTIGETYLIGGHNEQRNIDVVRLICSLLDELVPCRLEGIERYEELIRFAPDRPGHDRRYAIDASKIKNNLSWTPKENFISGMRKTVEWYLQEIKVVS